MITEHFRVWRWKLLICWDHIGSLLISRGHKSSGRVWFETLMKDERKFLNPAKTVVQLENETERFWSLNLCCSSSFVKTRSALRTNTTSLKSSKDQNDVHCQRRCDRGVSFTLRAAIEKEFDVVVFYCIIADGFKIHFQHIIVLRFAFDEYYRFVFNGHRLRTKWTWKIKNGFNFSFSTTLCTRSPEQVQWQSSDLHPRQW